MKKTTLSITILLVIFSFIFSGCGTAATPQSPADTDAPAPAEAADPASTADGPIPCTIVFDSDRDGNLEIYRMAPDGSEQTNLSNNAADDFNPSWSPDGSRIAFVSNRDNGDGGGQFIYVMNADGSDVRQLTRDNMSDFPDWSYDGSRITYSSNDDIYVINADGSGQSINLTNSPEKDFKPVWSRDDSKIGWLSGDDGNRRVFTMNDDGSDKQQLTSDGNVHHVQWTVNGQLFTNWDNQEHGCFNCVMNADGSNITDAGGKGSIQRYLPFWTEKGDRVECAQAAMDGDNEEIYLIGDIFPDMLNNLTNNPAQDRNPDWPAKCGLGSDAAAVESSPVYNDPDTIVLGYAGDDPEQYQRKDNFQKACNELGIQCLYGELPDLVAQGVDAVVQNASALTVDALLNPVLEAVDDGVPVFILDAALDVGGAYNITIDQHQWAQTGLTWMFDRIGGEGQIAYFDIDPVNRHSDTINEVLANYPDITVVEYRDDDGYDPNWIKPDTVDFMKTYPDLKAVWSNYNMTQAILGMDEESGMPQEQWPLVLCEANRDGLETWMRMREKYPDFDCIALVNPPGIAYDATYAAYYLSSGMRINQEVLGNGTYGNTIFVDIPVITGDDVQEWLDRVGAENMNIVDALMTPDEIKSQWFLD